MITQCLATPNRSQPHRRAGRRFSRTHPAPIWIRITGRWLPGHVQSWRRLPDGRWTAWLCYQADPEHPTVAPIWGHYAYDAEAILDRARWPQPPAES